MLGFGLLLQFIGHHTSSRASWICNRVSNGLSILILKLNLEAKSLAVYRIAGNLLSIQDQQVSYTCNLV